MILHYATKDQPHVRKCANVLTCSLTRSSSYSCFCCFNSAMEFSTSLTKSSVENCSDVQYIYFYNESQKVNVPDGVPEISKRYVHTCKFSRLKISPTARFCFITLVIFSLWFSRNSLTAFGLDRAANCCSFSFIFACSNKVQEQELVHAKRYCEIKSWKIVKSFEDPRPSNRLGYP